MNDDDGPDDFRERFLKANARLDFIAAQFADVIRDLMRAAGAGRPSAEAYRAAEKMSFVVELMSRTEEKFSFHHLFREALREFDDIDDGRDDAEAAMLHAARRGMKFFVESSCTDNAARGRASRRGDEFRTAIEDFDEARKDMRRRAGER